MNQNNRPEGVPQLQWVPIINLDQIRELPARNLFLNEERFLDMNEKYNRTFILVKNAINNYTLNLIDTNKRGPSILQSALDNINNKTATRIKLYPYKDIFSFTLYHSMAFKNLFDLSYQI